MKVIEFGQLPANLAMKYEPWQIDQILRLSWDRIVLVMRDGEKHDWIHDGERWLRVEPARES
jgi:hypothetical protein